MASCYHMYQLTISSLVGCNNGLGQVAKMGHVSSRCRHCRPKKRLVWKHRNVILVDPQVWSLTQSYFGVLTIKD